MKKNIVNTEKSMEGAFLPGVRSDNPFLSDIYKSINKLEFYGTIHDKKNLRTDTMSFNKDFNKTVKNIKKK